MMREKLKFEIWQSVSAMFLCKLNIRGPFPSEKPQLLTKYVTSLSCGRTVFQKTIT